VIPILARTRLGLAAARRTLRPPVVLVPTMGALHDGHRALLARAQEISQPTGSILVSVFINPLQFGAGEDLDRYPRNLDQDVLICAEAGADVVFAPATSQMYPRAQLITVDSGPVGQVLEGASRPGFFTGVLTVVLKLFELTQPDVAVFGEKDAQQLALVQRMTADFDLGIEIAAVPTVRDPDGLAVSSRNRYLSGTERAVARGLPRALRAGREAQDAGPEAVLKAAQAALDEANRDQPPLVTDYLALADPDTFEPVAAGHTGPALLLAAAWAGSTRLIDNVPLILGGTGGLEAKVRAGHAADD
jgi:pantoate--beta-alanine ligase